MVFAKTTIKGNTMSHHKHLELEERETILKYHTMVSVKSNTYNAKNPNQSHKLIWIFV